MTRDIFSNHKHGFRPRLSAPSAITIAFFAGGLSLLAVWAFTQHTVEQPPLVGRVEATSLEPLPVFASQRSRPSDRADISSPVATVRPARAENVVDIRGRTLAPSRPIVLSIPSIDVKSRINPVGQEADGTLEVPAPGPHYDEAAWYRHSPTPGSLGPAVVLGHVDSAANGPSVFFRLGEMRAGDRVTITRADGSIAVFVVDAVHRYAKDAFPTDRVYSNIDHAGLRIITCGGAFDNSTGHYLDNIVVFASLVA